MKLALVMPPPNEEPIAPPVLVPPAPKRSNRRVYFAAACGVVMCAASLWFCGVVATMMKHATAEPMTFAQRPDSSAATAPAEVPSPTTAPARQSWVEKLVLWSKAPGQSASRVLPFDGSRILQPGEKVVVAIEGDGLVAEVAGAPRDSVLFRRGSSLEGLYVLGESSYAVIAKQQSQVIRSSHIVATVNVAQN